ncbi:MAG: efflux RND transporter periplasmic adaptor subunit [Candidatus Omnitrophica bacterium]|nr:efflux RND transporter periplasmic adaptor subunit [Candidatus Omnitrophota bacterium]
MEIESPHGPVKDPAPQPPPNPFVKFSYRLARFLVSPGARKLFLWLLILAGCGFLIHHFFIAPQGVAPTEAPQEEKDQVVAVKAFKVGRYNYEDSLNALGTIKGGVEFKLSFEIPGVVSAVNYREGERYEEGALLISLKQDDILLRLKRAQAERSKSETALQIAQEKEKEHEKLFQIGAIPQTTLDKVRLEVESAKYDVQAASLEAKANEVMLEKSNLYAPTRGTIGELHIEEGEAITQNTLIGTHLSTDQVVAEFGVTERDLSKLSLGQKAKVFLDAYPDKTFEGTVESIGSAVIGESRTATVKVRIENLENLLVPGMFARIKILLYQKKNTLVLPTDSLQGKESDYSVFVIDPDTKTVHTQPVVIGYQRTDYAQVDSGVKEGDLVAITGLDRLKDETQVRVIETQEAEL